MSAYSAAVLADSPSFYARLGETSGTAAADAVGGTAGTYTGGFTLGQQGLLPADGDKAVALNGSTGYVTVADRAALDLADTFTLECWVYLTQYQDGSANPVTFIDKGANAYILRISNAVDGTFILRRNGVSTLVTSTARIPLRTVCHVVATKSGSTVKLYLNGLDVTGTVTNATMTDTALALGIGAADITAGPVNSFLGGTIDEVALYPSALSAARVQVHYLLGVGAMSFPTTSALDDFNRSNGALGGTWGTLDFQGTPLQVISNECGNIAGGSYWTTSFGADQECYADYRAGSGIWLFVRLASPLVDTSMTGYLLYWTSATSELYRVDAGLTYVLLGRRSVSLSAGDQLGIAAYGASIEAWHRPAAGSWTQDVAIADSRYGAGGYIGLTHDNSTTRTDNFSGGTAVAPPPRHRLLLLGVG